MARTRACPSQLGVLSTPMALNRETPRYSRSKNRRASQPSPELQKRIMARRITLDELFVYGRSDSIADEFLTKMRLVARCRFIGAFVHATDPRDQKGIDNCIIGCDGTVGDLVRHVSTHMQHSYAFVRSSDLPAQYSHLNSHWLEQVRGEARRLLLTEVLLGTQPGQSDYVIDGVLGLNVLYDHSLGLWMAGRSLIDEYEVIRAQIGEIVTPKRPPRKMG